MAYNKDISDLFKSHKSDIPDNGFTGQVMNRLPNRDNILPQIIIVLFSFLGFGLTIWIYGLMPLMEQINDLITSVMNLQIPPSSSIVAYLLVISSISIVGITVYRSENV